MIQIFRHCLPTLIFDLLKCEFSIYFRELQQALANAPTTPMPDAPKHHEGKTCLSYKHT